jgi:hypothetical protein
MIRLDEHLQKRIDRLARSAHAFHRYSHHPLCSAYAEEVLKIGRFWICRGCTFAMLGFGIGATFAAFVPTSRLTEYAVIGMCFGGIVAVSLWNVRLRASKVLTRLLPTFYASAVAVLFAKSCTGMGPVLLGLGLGLGLGTVVWARHHYAHRGPWREACSHCPERAHLPCSGFRLQVQRERAFVRLAHQWLDSSSIVGMPYSRASKQPRNIIATR